MKACKKLGIKSTYSNTQRGYSLLEAMAAVLIIGIFVYAAYPQYKQYLMRSYWHSNISEIAVIKSAIEQCAQENVNDMRNCNSWSKLDLTYKSPSFVDGQPYRLKYGKAELVPNLHAAFQSAPTKANLFALKITAGEKLGGTCELTFFPVWGPNKSDSSKPELSVMRWGVHYSNSIKDKCTRDFIGIDRTLQV